MTSSMRKTLPAPDEMTERLQTWSERYLVKGAAVAWIHGDESAAAAAGVINVNTGVETTTDTLFQIGSITKVYTATMIMQLVDEGRLDLDAAAVTYLPDLRFADATMTRGVTVRQLLTHTSGVDGDFFDDFGRGEDTVARYVEACAKLPFVFPPGAMWSYCNAGYVVLGRIIEALDGTTWGAALDERLLKPLGLARTTTLPEQALLHRTAAGHMVDLSRNVRLTPVWGMSWSQAPAGSTPCATVEDLLAFARMHIDGGVAPSGARVLSGSSVKAMQQVQVDLPDPLIGAAHWGLGWMLFDWDGRRVIGHDGGTIGQISSLRIWPEERAAVAILTNTAPTGGLLVERVRRWLFGEMGIELPPRLRPPGQPASLDLSLYAAVYERTGLRIEVTELDGRLLARYTNTGPLANLDQEMPPRPLIPVDASSFVQEGLIPGTYEPVRFSGFEAGRPRYLLAGRVARRVG